MPSTTGPQAKPKYIAIERSQMEMRVMDLESLIPAEHPARAIWELVGRLDLSAFEEEVQSWEGKAGAPRHSPRLLASLWLYGYSLGIASARALSRMSGWEPGLRWLCGDQEINHTTLCEFRVQDQERLNKLFVQILTVLENERLVDLKVVAQDGTKVRARAGKQSMHRRETVEREYERARRYMEALDREAEQEQAQDQRKVAARKRAAREQVDRLEAAMNTLSEREAAARPSQRAEVRVSISEPEAVKMKHADGSYAPSHNVQFSTDAKHKVIVAVSATQDRNDSRQLQPALEGIAQNMGRLPECLLADAGYATRGNVEVATDKKVELVAPWKADRSRQAGASKANEIDGEFGPSAFLWSEAERVYRCPEGKPLVLLGERKRHGLVCEIYQAERQQCAACPSGQRCCGHLKRGSRQMRRVRESDAMRTYFERMQRPEIQRLYRIRSSVAETPTMRIKENWGWRRFSVRGLAKAAKEAIWVALAYNSSIWARLRWGPQVAMG